jgi:hypothetical protein
VVTAATVRLSVGHPLYLTEGIWAHVPSLAMARAQPSAPSVRNTPKKHSATGPMSTTLLTARSTLADLPLSFRPFCGALLLGAGHCQAVP